jgi:sugar O-acyltransferase (sialic acid O-acetyltransferase NeuD family)
MRSTTGPILILGAGSQARVVADIIMAAAKARNQAHGIVGYIELGMDPARVGKQMLGFSVLGQIADLAAIIKRFGAATAALGYGENALRADLIAIAQAAGLSLPVIIHPSAVVSPTATLGPGTVVAAFGYVGTEARLAPGCIINTAAGADHDCVLEACVHLAVGARLAGNVQVGARTTIGAGATVIPGITVGMDVTVGAGAAVVSDLPDGCTAIGVPAKPRAKPSTS